MASMALARVKREIQEVAKDKQIAECNIKLSLVDDRDLTLLHGEIPGPPDTPYSGGLFRLEIRIPAEYPFSPPKVKFLTRVWHPNVSSQTGAICLDILKDQWAAAMTLRTVLLSIQALLNAAEPDDPQDAVVAQQYKTDRENFNKTAKHWTSAYAGGSVALSPEDKASLENLVSMGFEEEKARNALSNKNWNLQAALDYLCS